MRGIILSFLESHEYVKRPQLLSHLKSLGVETNDRIMRKEIEAIVEDGFCVMSSEKGYKIIRTEQELKDAVDYLKAKAFPLFRRAENLEKNFHSKTTKQTELFLNLNL